MHGTKIDQAKKALQLALRNMESGDSFNIVAFESRFHPYNETSVLYSQDEPAA
jgi:Ca-activated chloride channel family protein